MNTDGVYMPINLLFDPTAAPGAANSGESDLSVH